MSNHHLTTTTDVLDRKAQILRGFARANLAAIAVVLVVIALALVALAAAIKSETNARRAFASSQSAQAELWKSQLARARAERISGVPGSRQDGLAAVGAAAKIKSSFELRNEAVGLLALTDLVEGPHFWPHASNIMEGSLAFDADLKRFAWGDRPGTMHIYDMESGKELMRFRGPRFPPYLASFSPSGNHLAAWYYGGEFRLWTLTNGETAALRASRTNDDPLPREGFAARFALRAGQSGWMTFSPDGARIAITDDPTKTIRTFRVPDGMELASLSIPSPQRFEFSPDGARLAVAQTDGSMQIIDAHTGKLINRQGLSGFSGNFNWSNDGRSLACGMDEGRLLFWDIETNRTNLFSAHTSFISEVLTDPKNQLVVSRSWDGRTRLWDAATARPVLTTHRGYAMQFSRDGERLALLRERSGIGWWNVARSDVYRTLAPTAGPEGAELRTPEFSPDGRWLAVSTGDGIHVLEVQSGREIKILRHGPGGNTEAFFNVDGSAIFGVSADGIRRWNLNRSAASSSNLVIDDRGGQIRAFKVQELSGLDHSMDGALTVFSKDRQDVELFDTENAKVIQVFTNYPGVHSITVSPDRRWVVTGTRHGRGARLWNAQTGEVVRQLADQDCNVRFSPNGKWLAIGFGYEVVLLDTQTWQRRPGIKRDITSGLAGQIAFSLDSRWLAMLQSQQLVQLIDVDSNEVMVTLPSPNPQNIMTMSFSADGSQLAVSTGSEIQVWNIRALRENLSAMKLDWGTGADKPLIAAIQGYQPKSELVWLTLLTGGSMIAALGFVLVMWRRNQQWMKDYTEAEALVAKGNRDLQLAQQELLQSHKMKALGTLATGIAHDFNNLLSIIRMANKSIVRESRGEEAIEADTKDIEEAVLEGKNIVRSMLGYSREKTGPPEFYSAAEIASDTIALLSKQFLSGLEVRLDMVPNVPRVLGSPARLQQVLLNLIVNAAEAMNGRGVLAISAKLRITPVAESLELNAPNSSVERKANSATAERWILRPRSASQYLELAVKDSGPGISPELVGRIFEPFFTTKAVGGERGTGLGLYMVYVSTQAEGFGLSVESGIGAGTVFRIVMPVEGSADKTE